MELFTVKNLSFSIGQQQLLSDIGFSVAQGDFVTICGATGCGKTTLLRMLKKELWPTGTVTGELLYQGKKQELYTDRELAAEIGYVMQNPEHMIVTDRVWHELAFGLENLNIPSAEIHRRVAEMSAYFGIDDWFEQNTEELSGGQKQLLNLASVLVMHPKVLLLDEPTAQLDPIAAESFIQILRKLHEELGMTIILAEHRLEDTLPLSDQVLVLEAGRLVYAGIPEQAVLHIHRQASIYGALPVAARIYRKLTEYVPENVAAFVCQTESKGEMSQNSNSQSSESQHGTETGSERCPLTVAQGRRFLDRWFTENGHARQAVQTQTETQTQTEHRAADGKPALELDRVSFAYERFAPLILQEVSLSVHYGEIVCILGSNGSGKSTAVKVMAGIRKPLSGTVRVDGVKQKGIMSGKIAYLPQDVETVFVTDSIREELQLNTETWNAAGFPDFHSERYLEQHPYDLSGGEKQQLAMTRVFAGSKDIYLLDEPTKGLDAAARGQVCELLRGLREQGRAVLIVTHDIELAAACADRCGLFFRGELAVMQETRTFFQENQFYTTQLGRLTRGILEDVICEEDLDAVLTDHR